MNQLIVALIFAAATQIPSFEVASVKPSAPAEPNKLGFPVRSSFRIEAGGGGRASQITLRELVLNAYDLPGFRVDGGPSWITADRFDVMAVPEQGFSGTSAEVRSMLRALLAERFRLRVHTEQREAPVFYLITASQDGKLGRQMRPSSIDCEAVRRKRAPGSEPAGSEPRCRASFDTDLKEGTITIKAEGESMASLAQTLLSFETRRTVLDKTEIAGTFDLQLTFSPSEPLPGLPRLPGSENGVSLFTAIQEQLGLKLEAGRGMVEMLVIDAADKPLEN